jgi:hypothetical protein
VIVRNTTKRTMLSRMYPPPDVLSKDDAALPPGEFAWRPVSWNASPVAAGL